MSSEAKTPKHFNKAVVWGQLHEMTRKTSAGNKYYLELTIKCPFAKYGNVRVFGHLWGEEKVEEFLKEYKPGALLKLTGNFQQYKSKEETKSSFGFYAVEPWDPENDRHKHKRATFILQGEVNAVEDLGAMGSRLFIRIAIEQKDRALKEDILEILVPPEASLDLKAEHPVGAMVRVKGVIRQEEDEFGDVAVPSRPVAVTISRAGKEDEVPF